MLPIEDFFAYSMPPPVMAVLVYIVAYLLVDIPLSFMRDAESRGTWWAMWAGIFAALLYIAFVIWIYPDTRQVTNALHMHEAQNLFVVKIQTASLQRDMG